MKPLALDLCCGLGGWAQGLIAAGWDVLGMDFNPAFAESYPGDFICADLLSWEGWRESGASLVVASPPCEEFSRWSMPWTRSKNPPRPSLALVERCVFIAGKLGVPLVLENVRGAQMFLGRSALNVGAFHLWGAGVPALVPSVLVRCKESYGSADRARRAVVPFDLAYWVGRVSVRVNAGVRCA